MNRMEAENDSDILRGLPQKIDNKKRQIPIMGNRRAKIIHNYSVLPAMIMPMDEPDNPEEGQGFF